MPNHSSNEVLGFIDQIVRKDFDSNRRVLSFEEYLSLLGEQPQTQLRGSAKTMIDMMDHFGKTPVKPTSAAAQLSQPGSNLFRFHVFDQAIDASNRRVVGQELVQNQIYNSLRTFVRQGVNNKLILLHGPNGSAKTSLVHALMAGMERYSHEPQGAMYSFNWVFPVERYTKGGMGMNTYASGTGREREAVQSYAKLADEEVASRISCDMRDHPLLIIPVDQRRPFLDKLLGAAKAEEVWHTMPQYLTRGGLCHRCKQIADALLNANHGDFRKVLMHVQVERFYLARRYREGLVTVEPQLHVDAQYQQLTMNKSLASLPASLQSLNLFALGGDLVDGNRGVVEYSDLLKRPVDTFKYLLIACETGAVNVGSSIAYLDAVMLGSTNELQLDAFKEFPDFTSFKARIELIRVPYLLSVTEEQEIYKPDIEQIAGDRHVAPHTAWTLAQWSVLTRLKKPNSINYPPSVSSIVSALTPLEKARLYDTGDMPLSINPEERKLLRSSLRKLREEYMNIPYYEGRMGASAREMKSILYSAAQNAEFPCLSPLAVMREMEEFVKRLSEYEFLKQDVKDGFHDAPEFINIVRSDYLSFIDREVRDSIGLYDSQQWEEFLRKYVQHISLVLKKEKLKNPITGRLEDPDLALIAEFEKIVEAPGEGAERDSFRQNIISQIGAWSLDHPNEPVVYAKVFPEFWHKLEKHYYESQKALLTQMHNALLVYGSDAPGAKDPNDEGVKLARQTVENMKKKLGYCDHCAKEVITFLMRTRY
jgi:predicted Ser/Thr protein kinase